jgi:hypothetical protein
MLTIAQSLGKRGASGTPLPRVYSELPDICRGQLTLVIGPPSAGKSLLTMNLLAAMAVPSMAFLLDTTELTASARFASILSNEDYLAVKQAIIDGEDSYRRDLAAKLPDLQAVFNAPDPDAVQLQVNAFEQRYGLPPDAVVLDNIGNQASGYDNEWAVSKALTLEYDLMARREQVAVIATAHTTDLDSAEPAQRTKLLGKISQYARLILSVAYDSSNGTFKVAVVKNSEGVSDPAAKHPIILYADPSRMQLSETPPHPQINAVVAEFPDWRRRWEDN